MIAAPQLRKLNRLLNEVWERNPFYTAKWCRAGVTIQRLRTFKDLHAFPFTTREELRADQLARPPLGANLTCPLADIKHVLRSSGTSGQPLFWGDTAQSWDWVLHCSASLFLISGVRPADRLFFTGSFGASSGPWIIHGGASRLGCGCINAPSPDLAQQVEYVARFRPSVVVGRPSHLQALAEAARVASVSLRRLRIEKLIFTGEPGGNVGSTRRQLEKSWGAAGFDRYGFTEAGSVASECLLHDGRLHVLDDEFLVEVVDPDTGAPLPDGEPGELVVSNFGRVCRPIVRYRTGDLARLYRQQQCPCGRSGTVIVGGVHRRSPSVPRVASRGRTWISS